MNYTKLAEKVYQLQQGIVNPWVTDEAKKLLDSEIEGMFTVAEAMNITKEITKELDKIYLEKEGK